MRGQGTISAVVLVESNKAYLRISDTGKGIARKDYKRIFSPGVTTKRRGWGLGLSLARRIIEDYHKGKIRVLKSGKNQGTTIELILPLAS